MTEDEAKLKWCPHARVSHDGTGNRYAMDTDYSTKSAFATCIASDCMQGCDINGNWRGYCGLAGPDK